MAIERFNPDGLHATPGYHHVTIVDAGRTAYLAGQCPLDADGNVVGTTHDEAGLAAQVHQVAANALVALTAAGAAPADVIRSVIYVVSDDVAALVSVWRQLTESALAPAFTTASTLLGVSQLGFRHQRVELDLTAALH
jgi:enamine deaminase RidA (YjgF/YER057c/UK114 family)